MAIRKDHPICALWSAICASAPPDAHLLLALLPSIIHIRGLKRLATVAQLIRDEAQDTMPARDMIIEHLLQVLLIETLHSAFDSVASPGLLRRSGRLPPRRRYSPDAPGTRTGLDHRAIGQ